MFLKDAVPTGTGPLFFSVPPKGGQKKKQEQGKMIEPLTMAYLEKLPSAISGSGGHNATLRMACECFRRGLNESDVWEALQWYNSNRCSPAWSEKALRHKMEDAARVVGKSGEMGKFSRGGFQKKVRTFSPPIMPARPARAIVPVCNQSEANEEAWWERVAIQRGCTLAEWDSK